MIAGVLEVQLMANMARLSKDMRQAEKVVGGSMNAVENSVNRAKNSMKNLGMGLTAGLALNTLRRTVDAYTKLDAQLKLSTKSQQSYNQAVSDIRRISAIAQSDINGTTMLYTRLMNVMDGSGVAQSKLATMTETISFGLKAYGATAAEAASASLQLSQAMGANRLGGEEFRAVMEAMPNVMKILANSMGVPLGELRALSIAGKITAQEMLKAWGNQDIADVMKKHAINAQTISGAMTEVRNETTLLVGEFMKLSGGTGSISGTIKLFAESIRLTAKYINELITIFEVYLFMLGAKLITRLVKASLAQRALNVAQAESAATALAAARANAIGAQANLLMNIQMARATGISSGLAAATKQLTAANVALATAQTAAAATSMTLALRLKMLVASNAWLIGFAALAAVVVTLKNSFDDATKSADKFYTRLKELSVEQLVAKRQLEQAELASMQNSAFKGFYERDIRMSQDRIRMYDMQIDRIKKLEQAAADTPTAYVKNDMWEKLFADKKKQYVLDLEELDKMYLQEAKSAGNNMEAQLALAKGWSEKRIYIEEDYRKKAIKEANKLQDDRMQLQADNLRELEEHENKWKAKKDKDELARRKAIGKAIILQYQKEQEILWDMSAKLESKLGDVFYNAMNGKFDSIAEMFKQMLYRMAADAAAARLTEAMFGSKGSGSTGWVQSLIGAFGSAGGGSTPNTESYTTPSTVGHSFAGGGYTGDGSRSGGLDGQGGFMAILHPREDVIDRTKGGGRGSISITHAPVYNIDARSDRAAVRQDMERISRQGNADLVDRLSREGMI